jgi:outer membrane protein OmpA-like peptidoglycan-associated protein
MRWLICFILLAGAALGPQPARAQDGPTAVLCAGFQHQWDAVKGGTNTAAMQRVVQAITPNCATLLRQARLRLAAVERRPVPSPPRPAAPRPAGPAARQTRDFLIFFPFDQYVLTADAQAVVAEAARFAAESRSARVAVVGRADEDASAAGDMRLAERRAKATADQLVSSGVARASLDVSWTGQPDSVGGLGALPGYGMASGGGMGLNLNRLTTITIAY